MKIKGLLIGISSFLIAGIIALILVPKRESQGRIEAALWSLDASAVKGAPENSPLWEAPQKKPGEALRISEIGFVDEHDGQWTYGITLKIEGTHFITLKETDDGRVAVIDFR